LPRGFTGNTPLFRVPGPRPAGRVVSESAVNHLGFPAPRGTLMKRLLTGLAALGLIVVAAAVSGNARLAFVYLQIQQEDRTPWTNLRLNNDPSEFKFLVVSDRTGGHRAGVFSQAVEQINLLQPEFVVSVGDLIEGYTKDADKLTEQWKEF